jgi:hypothetical protein
MILSRLSPNFTIGSDVLHEGSRAKQQLMSAFTGEADMLMGWPCLQMTQSGLLKLSTRLAQRQSL